MRQAGLRGVRPRTARLGYVFTVVHDPFLLCGVRRTPSVPGAE